MSEVLFIVQLPPPIHGAALRNEFLASSKLLNQEFNITILPLRFAKDVKDIGRTSVLKLAKMIVFCFKLVYQLIFHRPDMVYYNFAVNGVAFYRDVFYTAIIKLFRVKRTYHLRTQGVNNQCAKSIILKFLFRFAFKNTKLICLSNYLARDVESVYREKPLIIENGINLEVSDEEIKAKKKSDTVRFVYLSNLTKSKGIIELIEALILLKQENLNFSLKIIGPEYDISANEIRNIVKEKGLSNKVEIKGPVYGKEKFEIFLSSDIFVFPTWFEAFPAVVLEAMQCELPVISTREGAIPEIINDGKTGFIVDPKNSIQLAEKMKVLLLDKDLRLSMGIAGRKKFLKQYTSDLFEIRMANAFKKQLAN